MFENKLFSASFGLGRIPVIFRLCCHFCLFYVQFFHLFQTPNIKTYPALMDVFA